MNKEHSNLSLMLARLGLCKEIDGIAVLTPDEAIADVAETYGHTGAIVSGGDPADLLGQIKAVGEDQAYGIVVHVAGNQPLIDPAVLDALVRTLRKTPAHVVSCEKPHGCEITVLSRMMLNQLNSRISTMRRDLKEAVEPGPIGARVLKLRAVETRFRFDVRDPSDQQFIRALVKQDGPMAPISSFARTANMPEFKELVVLDDPILTVLGDIEHGNH